MKEITKEQYEQLLVLQQEEINGYHTYNRLSKIVKDPNNSKILKRIAGEDCWRRHALANAHLLVARMSGQIRMETSFSIPPPATVHGGCRKDLG